MAAIPLLEESSWSPSGALIAGLADWPSPRPDPSAVAVAPSHPRRKLAIYPAAAGFDLVDELDFLSARAVEPNIFFNPRFLAPAMPRLEDREVRLAVIRDGDEEKSRLRLLVPLTVEKPASPFGVPTLRTWANPFGPLGTPLLDCDDPMGVLDDFLAMLARPHLGLPKVFVLPEMRLDGPVATLLKAVAAQRKLPVEEVGRAERPFLQSRMEPDDYLRAALRAHHFREFRRLKRRLEAEAPLEHLTLRGPDQVRLGVEAFLSLEAAGWKGRHGTAMAIDRFRAAFAREAVHRMAEQDLCRVHLLRLGGKVIAALIVLVERGMAYTWKTAYDEAYAAFSPGTLLMIEVTREHLADAGIEATDSCAVPDHPVMSRIWSERRSMGTIAVGLAPGAERLVRQAAQQFVFGRDARNAVRLLRRRLKALIGRH
ncbi:MAG TPA: GNAT family N-acetyltransferase [Mesorhizobium sp.]|jgi:hypothetical protein|nr:GNAT family N-acetyltransferase [Mesorhizobium sp.]